MKRRVAATKDYDRLLSIGTVGEALRSSQQAQRGLRRKQLRKIAAIGVVGLGISLLPSTTHATPFSATFSLDEINGTNGIILEGKSAGDRMGNAVAGAGDINGDGFDDVIISASSADSTFFDSYYGSSQTVSGGGQSYVVFGGPNLSNNFNVGNLNGSNGFSLNGGEVDEIIGVSVDAAGDINNDGFDDLIVGAPYSGNNSQGAAYVVFGKDTTTNAFDADEPLGLFDGTDGFDIGGLINRNRFGRSVSGAGDLNGDGFDDLVIGALDWSANPGPYGGTRDGRAHVLFGGSSFNGYVPINGLNGSNGFTVSPNDGETSDQLGITVSEAGDFNGDGFEDVVIGAFNASPPPVPYGYGTSKTRTGEAYVIFGTNSGFPSDIQPEDLNGINGFAINGATDFDSASVIDGGGDMNGDGFDDLIVVAINESPSGVDQEGVLYVVFGTDGSVPAQFDLENIDGTNGFRFEGEEFYDFQSFSVDNIGDVNGDGLDDLIAGGHNQNSRAFVIFGSTDPYPSDFSVSSLDGTNGFIIEKGTDGYTFEDFAGAGDVNGDGLNDIVIGSFESTAEYASNAGRAYIIFGQSSTAIPEPSSATGLISGMLALLTGRRRRK